MHTKSTTRKPVGEVEVFGILIDLIVGVESSAYVYGMTTENKLPAEIEIVDEAVER